MINRQLQKACIKIATLILLVSLWFVSYPVSAAEISSRSIDISTSTPSAVATHVFSFDYVSGNDVGSISIEYCENSPVIGLPCTPPVGLDATSAVLSGQSGEVNFTIDAGASSVNEIILTRPLEPVTPGPSSYTFDNVINPSGSNTTFYARITTYASADATGPLIDGGGLAASTSVDVTVNAYVPPFLEFCVGLVIFANDCTTASGSLIDLGSFSDISTVTAISKFQAGTNAFGGYNVIVTGTTLTSGNNLIAALENPAPSVPGAAQFGMNLRANTVPSVGLEPSGPGSATPTARYNNINNFTFRSGDQIAFSPTSNDRVTFTVSYIANIESSQKKGFYSTTLTYICTGAF